MPVVMVSILRFGTHVDKGQHDDIGDEIRERVHGIGNHRRAMSHDTRNKLEGQQRHIARTAHQRHLIYLFLSIHNITTKIVLFIGMT